MPTIQGLKKYLKTTVLDDNIKFNKIENDKIYATLKNGKQVYWAINEDLTLKSNWYYNA